MDISTAWPYVLSIAPVVVGSAAFIKTVFEIRELQLKIRKLRDDDSKQALARAQESAEKSVKRVRRVLLVFLSFSLLAAISVPVFLRGQSLGIAKERVR